MWALVQLTRAYKTNTTTYTLRIPTKVYTAHASNVKSKDGKYGTGHNPTICTARVAGN